MNRLDERERQEASKVEHIGLRVGYVLLLAMIAVQIFMGAPFSQYAGETLVTLGMSICLIIGYARYGIWDDGAAPGIRDNMICSGLCGASVAVLSFGLTDKIGKALVMGILTFAIAMGVLTVMLRLVEHRRQLAEQEYENDD